MVNNNVAGRVRLCYTFHMTKTEPIGVRLEPEERAAIEAAAAADDRPVSSLMRRIIVEWLRKNGWLPIKPKARAVRGKTNG